MSKADDHIIEAAFYLPGCSSNNLDAIARELVTRTPSNRRQNDLRYILERALALLDQDVSGKGIE